MARPHVPEFGKWNQGVPYTVYFETARKGRKGDKKKENPSDPQENPELFSDNDSVVQAPSSRSKEPLGQPASRSRHEHKTRKEDLGLGHSPARYNAGTGTAGSKSQNQQRGASTVAPSSGSKEPLGQPASRSRHEHETGASTVAPGGEIQKGAIRSSAQSESNFNRSPLHQQAKASGRGVGTPYPSWEGKGSDGSSQGTAAKSRRKQPGTPLNDSLGKEATIPPFGDWKNGSSGDGYTEIFNKARVKNKSPEQVRPEIEQQIMASPKSRKQKSSVIDSLKACMPCLRQ